MSALTQQQHQSRQQHSHSGNDRAGVQRAVARSDRQPDAEERKADREQDWCGGIGRPTCVPRRHRRPGRGWRRIVIGPCVTRVYHP